VKLNDFFLNCWSNSHRHLLIEQRFINLIHLTNGLNNEWIAGLRAKTHRAFLWPLFNTLESFTNCFPMKHSGHLNALHFFDDSLILTNCSVQLSVKTSTSWPFLCFINCWIRKLAAFNETISAWKRKHVIFPQRQKEICHNITVN